MTTKASAHRQAWNADPQNRARVRKYNRRYYFTVTKIKREEARSTSTPLEKRQSPQEQEEMLDEMFGKGD